MRGASILTCRLTPRSCVSSKRRWRTPLSRRPYRWHSPMRNDTAAAPELRLDLDHFLPYRLSVLSNRVSSAIARQYSGRFDLNVPEWRTMAVLGGTPGLSAREVAARTAMDKVQVSRAVASLMRARRVARGGDASDGRVFRLSLTAKG